MSILNVNGKLTRIDTVAYGVTGDAVYTSGDALDVDVTIDEPTRQQRYTLGSVIADASAVIYVLVGDLPDEAQEILNGTRLVANQEERPSLTYVVLKAQLRVFDDLSHYELFCKVA